VKGAANIRKWIIAPNYLGYRKANRDSSYSGMIDWGWWGGVFKPSPDPHFFNCASRHIGIKKKPH
jgi:hypothetical protein